MQHNRCAIGRLAPVRGNRVCGQGMTEYIVIVALIAVAAIGTYSLLGQTVRNQTAGLALEISGKPGRAAISAAGTNATQAQAKANKKKGLSNYDEGNTQ
ncbi:MAG: Flp family type IVb pilin [Burkholderiaceae bacterium]